MSPERSSVDKANKNWLPWQRHLRDRKKNFRLIVYSHISTNPEKLAKLDLVDLDIIGLMEILKNK